MAGVVATLCGEAPARERSHFEKKALQLMMDLNFNGGLAEDPMAGLLRHEREMCATQAKLDAERKRHAEWVEDYAIRDDRIRKSEAQVSREPSASPVGAQRVKELRVKEMHATSALQSRLAVLEEEGGALKAKVGALEAEIARLRPARDFIADVIRHTEGGGIDEHVNFGVVLDRDEALRCGEDVAVEVASAVPCAPPDLESLRRMCARRMTEVRAAAVEARKGIAAGTRRHVEELRHAEYARERERYACRLETSVRELARFAMKGADVPTSLIECLAEVKKGIEYWRYIVRERPSEGSDPRKRRLSVGV